MKESWIWFSERFSQAPEENSIELDDSAEVFDFLRGITADIFHRFV